MATYKRKNVYSKGGTFSDPTLLWYARGVKAMNARKLDDAISWRFYAAIHGFIATLWGKRGYWTSAETMPSGNLQSRFWNQCQHGSWYFFPWHRGYLMALEKRIRAEVTKLGGPSDWALPYWNYFGPGNQNQLPPAFATPDWPDGKGDNPLFISQRYGPRDDGHVYVPQDQVNLDAMAIPEFTGVSKAERGFGGLDTGFEHGGPTHGSLERQPHDTVHGLVGGQNPKSFAGGLMSDPNTAGLDPIFYLHHCNIDRLWEVWIQGSISQGNPTEDKWTIGPQLVGQRGFAMPQSPAGDAWTYRPSDVADLSSLDYTYDDVSPAAEGGPVAAALAAALPQARLRRLGAGAKAQGAAMATPKQSVELVGANKEPLRITGRNEVHASVQLDKIARRKVSASLAAAAAAETTAPDRVFLNLENVRGLHDATMFQVFVNERLADTVALFGVSNATVADGEHAGQGLNIVIDITKIVDELHLNDAFDVNQLDIRILPLKHVPDEAQVSIGRISIFRQGQAGTVAVRG
jgi:tyrosinase